MAVFYNPTYKMQLQNHDTWIAEKVLNHMTEKRILVLPIHDSFITEKEHKETLLTTMSEIFYEVFLQKPTIK